MSINFENIGYINFDKEYNKVVKKGKTIIGTNVSFSSSTKNKDGEWETSYFKAFIPQKCMPKNAKELINEKLVKMRGIVTKTVKDGKHYHNFTIMEFDEYVNEKKDDDINEDDLPF